jgi:hypothetical protein
MIGAAGNDSYVDNPGDIVTGSDGGAQMAGQNASRKDPSTHLRRSCRFRNAERLQLALNGAQEFLGRQG